MDEVPLHDLLNRLAKKAWSQPVEDEMLGLIAALQPAEASDGGNEEAAAPSRPRRRRRNGAAKDSEAETVAWLYFVRFATESDVSLKVEILFESHV